MTLNNGKKKVLLIAGDYLYRKLLQSMDLKVIEPYNIADCIRKDIDLVMFTGGADVHPKFYGGIHNGISMTSEDRDKAERIIFKYYQHHKVKMTGICRGIQFINVMCGGEMFQHTTRHAGPWHNTKFLNTDKVHMTTSTHHQMVILPSNAYIVAVSDPSLSTEYIGPDGQKAKAPPYEIEAAVFPEFNSFGVQFHPEMMSDLESGHKYYKEVLNDFIEMDINAFTDRYAYKGDKYVNQSTGG